MHGRRWARLGTGGGVDRGARELKGRWGCRVGMWVRGVTGRTHVLGVDVGHRKQGRELVVAVGWKRG